MSAASTPRRRPTMRDVAREAGVSQALVSIVFRGAPGASTETRARVLEAAERIDYVRDERARLLRTSRSTDIGVCFETQQPFHHQLLDELYEASDNAGHSIILSGVSSSRDERRALAGLVAYRCGAIISLGTGLTATELRDATADIPVISVARPMGQELDWVASDDESAMRQAVQHLVALGHSSIVFASSPPAAGAAERETGFRRGLNAQGVSGAIADGGTTESSGADFAAAMIENGDLPTALIAFNDRSALGMLDVFVRKGISVPDDISVVGTDDSEIAARSYVRLTTIAQDPGQLGRDAARLAIERISDGNRAHGADRCGTMVPTSLVVRETTGPPRIEDGAHYLSE